jgi:hypothetical protein
MIAVECFADMTLVQCLTSLPRNQIAHYFRGKSGVCTQLQQNTQSIGLIDEDPFAAKHPFEKMGVFDDNYVKYDIKYRLYPSQSNRLIILCPKLEDWIIESARQARVDLVKNGLPDDPNSLHNVIDQKLNEFRVIIALLKKNRSDRLETLSNLLKPIEVF